MLRKIVSVGLICTMLFPTVALARHHSPPPKRHGHHYRPRHHARHYSHYKKWHKGDYVAVDAGVIIGVILANK